MQAMCETVPKKNVYVAAEAAQQAAISFFEDEIKQYMQMGRIDRNKAIDWIFDANLENFDLDEDDEDEMFDECDRFIGKKEIDINVKYELIEKQYNLPQGYIRTVNHLFPFNK